ncbi:MAG: nicotinate-nicotinamide nucleotide adenylyltransferase [Gemmatimonadetes bacterium]|nr:nicotinate-nicotinamide nucleotide adenylyltransferase [Gemmatimonadota bacterium]
MNTLENYRILMDSLDPHHPPAVRFVHRAAPRHPKHIGVLDASFNPLTLAHEALVHHAQNAFNFDEIVLLLAKTNVDKALSGADLSQRLAMMVKYADSDTQLDTCLSIAGCSHARFIDKAHALRTHFSPDVQIYFLVGHDTLIRIFDPHYYTDMPAELKVLFSLCHIVSANRENSSRAVFHRFMSRPECASFANRVHPLQLPPSFGNISSTEVRKRIRSGDPITDLVPESIAQFIETFDLYK